MRQLSTSTCFINAVLANAALITLLVGGLTTGGNVAAQEDYQSRTPAEWRALLAAPGDDWFSRSRAAYVLARLDKEQPAAAAALAEALNDRNLVIRWYAADGLGRLGEVANPMVDRMAESLAKTSHDKDVRRNIARSLGRIGHATPQVIKALQEALKHDDHIYAADAAEALVKLNENPAYTRLVDLLADPEPAVVFASIRSMERLAEKRTPPAKRLTELFGHSSSDVRRAAARVVGRQGWVAAPDVLAIWNAGAPPNICLQTLSYMQAPTNAQQRTSQKAALENAWPLVSNKNLARSASALISRQGTESVASLLEEWPKRDDAAWRQAALKALEKWSQKNKPLMSSRDAWKDVRDSVRGRLLELIPQDDAGTRRLALWLIAELPLGLTPGELAPHQAIIRAGLRDPDVVNRRNAARIVTQILGGEAAPPTPKQQ